MHPGTFRTWAASAAISAVVATGVVVATSQDSEAATNAAASSSTAATSTANASSTTSTDALEAIETDARFSVSVLDVDSGASLTYGDGSFDTASIVKVDILAALLAQHQEAGTELTATEQAQAAAMIEQSANDAATALLEAVGGEVGLEAFNETIGLTETDIGADGYWGLTQTTSADQVRLLQVVLGDDSVLTPDAQAYARSLMSNVVDTQVFGVSAAADDADNAVLKVGYLQRSATGLWDVTSIGEIESGGRTYLVAILSDGSASYDAGVTLVDEIARAAVSGMTAI
ncbi:serine hydrolase [Aeromicrobium stalagmiti]|uniref:serine hydrolase n=1 Tax=Aeromicrobium stalagmiti TaxID=2738988 RepID=UPI00156A2388|nr:serine hydrolase [Aeromicrobium stalagmiti]NRQ49722.1 serine hydrolase [Aeromicrobium stalagmiti]